MAGRMSTGLLARSGFSLVSTGFLFGSTRHSGSHFWQSAAPHVARQQRRAAEALFRAAAGGLHPGSWSELLCLLRLFSPCWARCPLDKPRAHCNKGAFLASTLCHMTQRGWRAYRLCMHATSRLT